MSQIERCEVKHSIRIVRVLLDRRAILSLCLLPVAGCLHRGPQGGDRSHIIRPLLQHAPIQLNRLRSIALGHGERSQVVERDIVVLVPSQAVLHPYPLERNSRIRACRTVLRPGQYLQPEVPHLIDRTIAGTNPHRRRTRIVYIAGGVVVGVAHMHDSSAWQPHWLRESIHRLPVDVPILD